MTRFTFLAAAVFAVAGAPASAEVITLDFEGISPTYPFPNNISVNSFYNGGTASNGVAGPNFGVEFTSAAIVLCLNRPGTICSNTSKGELGIPTSRNAAMFFPGGNPIMNVAAGFDTGFSGNYSAPFSVSGVEVWSGLNATGMLLASTDLALTPNGLQGACPGFSANYCPFLPFSLAFAGVAQSVRFTGPVNQQVFDDLTFGSLQPGGENGVIPEPGTWAMMIAGFGLVGTALRRRRMAVAA